MLLSSDPHFSLDHVINRWRHHDLGRITSRDVVVASEGVEGLVGDGLVHGDDCRKIFVFHQNFLSGPLSYCLHTDNNKFIIVSLIYA